jgi:hypothetical protein
VRLHLWRVGYHPPIASLGKMPQTELGERAPTVIKFSGISDSKLGMRSAHWTAGSLRERTRLRRWQQGT